MKNTLVYWVSAFLLLVGCTREVASPRAETDLNARNAAVETCAACGMVVREQPAPRGQVVHRDGTRVFLCSLGDLLRYLEVPSPHGKPQMVYSEAMAADHALVDMDREWQHWNRVSELFFVIKIDRPGIMGAPVMAYETKEAAEQAAENFNGEMMNFTQLQERYAE